VPASPSRPAKPAYIFLSAWPVKAGAGVNNVILGLADAMAGRYRPQLVVTGWTPPFAGQRWLKLPSPLFSLKSRVAFLLHFLPNMLRLRRLVRGAVAVNPHFFGLEILPLAILRTLRLSPPLILSVHGADVAHAQETSGVAAALYSWLYARADLVVACSNALGHKVKKMSPEAKVAAVWNAVSTPSASTGERPISSRFIVCVAAFVRKKAHDNLLYAFRRISADYSDLKLILIGGDGPEYPSVVNLIATLGLTDRVELHINLPHERIWPWLQHAECFVLPSRDEPFGIAVLEAGMMRTPVVATRVGGVPEFLSHGVHGLLCEPDQPDSLAAAILEVLNNPVAAQARADAFYLQALEFTWQGSFEKYRRLADLP